MQTKETVCMKCQTLFSENNIIKLLSVEFALSVVKVKREIICLSDTNLEQGLYKSINANNCWSQLNNDMALFFL